MKGRLRNVGLAWNLRTTTRLERATRRRLVDLHRLISLDPVFGDSETDSGLWQFLNPGSRDVEEICLLADRLFDLLVEIGELDDEVGAFAVEGLDAA